MYAKSPYDANEDGAKDHENRLSLKLGDAVRVLNTSMGKGWWWVEVDGESGYVPSSFLGTEDDLRGAEEASWQNEEYFDFYPPPSLAHGGVQDRHGITELQTQAIFMVLCVMCLPGTL